MGNHESALRQRQKAREKRQARIDVLEELLEAQCTGCRLKMKVVPIPPQFEADEGQIHENEETGKLRFCKGDFMAILMLERERNRYSDGE